MAALARLQSLAPVEPPAAAPKQPANRARPRSQAGACELPIARELSFARSPDDAIKILARIRRQLEQGRFP